MAQGNTYDLPDKIICLIRIYANDTSLYRKCGWVSDLWQKLELASELESDLRRTWRETSYLLISILQKLKLLHLIMQPSSLRCWDCPSSFTNPNEAFITSVLLKLYARKLEPWLIQEVFFKIAFYLSKFII